MRSKKRPRHYAFYEMGLQFLANDKPTPEVLSPAERAVFILAGQSAATEAIADALCISPKTVMRRRRSIMRKLQLPTQADLVRTYIETTSTPDKATRARYLVENVLPTLVGSTILAPVLMENDWCALLVRLKSGVTRRLWILCDEIGDESGWVYLD